MANLGFVGLGVMGGRIAERLLAGGHRVTGYNRTRARAGWLVERGLRLADSPRAVAEAAETTFTMVSDAEALRAVTAGPDGILAGLCAGKVLVEMSTVGQVDAEELAGAVEAVGARMLDAPVMGTVVTFERGKLPVMMVGGDQDSFQSLLPVAGEFVDKVVHVGGPGKAKLLKAAINLGLPIEMAALAEGLVLAERAGIPRAAALEVMRSSPSLSLATVNRLPFIDDLPEEPWFDVVMMQKDLDLALERGRALGVPLSVTAAVQELLTACRGLGFGKQDFAAIYHALALLSAPAERPPGTKR